MFEHLSGFATQVDRNGKSELELAQNGYEVVSISPVQSGIAVIGLIDKFNAGAGIDSIDQAARRIVVTLRDGGRFAIWCEHAPVNVKVDGVAAAHEWTPASGIVEVGLMKRGQVTVVVEWA